MKLIHGIGPVIHLTLIPLFSAIAAADQLNKMYGQHLKRIAVVKYNFGQELSIRGVDCASSTTDVGVLDKQARDVSLKCPVGEITNQGNVLYSWLEEYAQIHEEHVTFDPRQGFVIHGGLVGFDHLPSDQISNLPIIDTFFVCSKNSCKAETICNYTLNPEDTWQILPKFKSVLSRLSNEVSKRQKNRHCTETSATGKIECDPGNIYRELEEEETADCISFKKYQPEVEYLYLSGNPQAIEIHDSKTYGYATGDYGTAASEISDEVEADRDFARRFCRVGDAQGPQWAPHPAVGIEATSLTPSLKANGNRNYEPVSATDGNPDTAWCVRDTDHSELELRIAIRPTSKAKSCRIAGLYMTRGYWKTNARADSAFLNNNRLTSVALKWGSKAASEYYNFDSTSPFVKLDFKDPYVISYPRDLFVHLKIMSVERGDTANDTCISEISPMVLGCTK